MTALWLLLFFGGGGGGGAGEGGPAGCAALSSARITGLELARFHPEFAAAGSRVLLAAPRPGWQRELTASQVGKLAAAAGVPLAAPGRVCFERPGRVLAEDEVRAALREALGEALRFEVTGFTRERLPLGTLAFEGPPRRIGLAEMAVKGRVEDAAGERYPVWARFRVLREARWLEAAASIAAGEVLRPENTRLREAPLSGPEPAAPELLLGRVARRALAPGAVLTAAHVAEPPLVRPGQPLRVTAAAGGAAVAFPATAESVARLRETIVVRGPDGRTRLRAVVTGPGEARIEAGTGGRR
jgi:flagella basal body P-ring formation protein FlgA